MRVELLVNLKVANGSIIRKGTVFDDTYSPIPGVISRKIGTNLVRIISNKPKSHWSEAQIIKEDSSHFEELPPKESEIMSPEVETEVVEKEPEVEEESVEKTPVKRTYARKKKSDSEDKPKRTRRTKKKVEKDNDD